MAAPATIEEFLDLIRKSGVADSKQLEPHVQKLRAAGGVPTEPAKFAGILIRDGFLTHFQAEHLLQGKWRRFTIGKYKVLEKLGSGGMGQVYLCEHKLMRRRVAVKVLPTAKAADDSARERFYREARAVAALDHPNIVHAYDIDQDENLHFIVMEYVDGANLQEIIKKTGPMDVTRACHYVHQAALGLEHAHHAGLVHRDIKPGNILVDRTGVVKVLDMGLARFFNDEEDILTRKYDENVLGTADYLAPEQAIDSHGVDIRADIYSLGATFYFMLTGKAPFGEGTVAQKLIWHQTRQPKILAEIRKDVPPALQAILTKMMAKEPSQRFPVPGAVAEALTPFTQTPIAPPPDIEMPNLSPAATGIAPPDAAGSTAVTKGPTLPEPIRAAPRPTPKAVPSPAPAPNPVSALKAPTPFPMKTVAPPPPAPPSSAPARVAAVAPPPPAPVPTWPTQAPATHAVAVTSPGPAQEPEEESPPWENFTYDTEDPTAKADTEPQSVAARPARGEEPARTREKQRLWRAATIIAIPFAVVVAFLLWRFVLFQTGPGTRVRLPLTVAKDGSKGFKTIRHALHEARSGDIIEIHDDVIEEIVVIDKAVAPHVTLQAAPGKAVTWYSSSKKDEKNPLLFFSKAAGFRIKGITLDGTLDAKRKVDDLVLITSYCPGLTLEDLEMRGFGKTAVRIMNAEGEEKNPIRLHNLSITGGSDQALVGIFFDINVSVLPQFNDWIAISDTCTFTDLPAANTVKMKDNTVNNKNVLLPKSK